MVKDLHNALPVEPPESLGARSKSLRRLCLTFSLQESSSDTFTLKPPSHFYNTLIEKHYNAWKPFRNSFPGVSPSRRAERNQRTKQLQGTYWKTTHLDSMVEEARSIPPPATTTQLTLLLSKRFRGSACRLQLPFTTGINVAETAL